MRSSCKTSKAAQDNDDERDEREDAGDGGASSGGGAGSAGIGAVSGSLFRHVRVQEKGMFICLPSSHLATAKYTLCSMLADLFTGQFTQ